MTEQLTHTRSCDALTPGEACTCCLKERQATQSAMELYAAWRKRAEEAEQRSTVRITAKALREALEFCNPDGPEDVDQMETEITIWMREKDEVATDGEPMPRGLYCHLSEYPEEGCIPLFEVTANVELTGAERASPAKRPR